MAGGAASTKARATWTDAQDELLAYWQSKVGNRWSVIAQYIPGKTGQQCAQRWRHRVNPNIRKDKWTAQEDAMLTNLVAQYGGAWAEIARHMPGRTDQQCMGRWKRHLDPGISRAGWTAQEDAVLSALVAQHGHAWSTISSYIPGRIAQQCRSRWKQLSTAPYTLPQYQRQTPRDRLTAARDGSPAAPPTRRPASYTDEDEEFSDLSDHESDPGSAASPPAGPRGRPPLPRGRHLTAKSPGSTAYNSVISAGCEGDEDEGDIVHSHSATMTAGLRSHASFATGSYEPDAAPRPPVPFSPIHSPPRRARSTRSAARRGIAAPGGTPDASPLPAALSPNPRMAPVPFPNPAATSSIAAGLSARSSQLCKHGSNDPAGTERLHELVRMSELLEKAEEEGSITDGQPEDTSPVVVDTAELAHTPSARRPASKYNNQSVPASWKVYTTTPKAHRTRPIAATDLDALQPFKGRRQQEQAASTEETVGDEAPGIASPPFSHGKWNSLLSPPAGNPTALLRTPSNHGDGVRELLATPEWAGSARRAGHPLTTPPTSGPKVQRRLLAAYDDVVPPAGTPTDSDLFDSPAKRQRLTRRSITGSLSLAGQVPQAEGTPGVGGPSRPIIPLDLQLASPPAPKPPKESRLAGALALLGQMDEQGTDRQRRRMDLRSEASANDRASLNVAADKPAHSAATESSQGNHGSALGTPGTKQQVASSAPKRRELRRELHSLLDAQL